MEAHNLGCIPTKKKTHPLFRCPWIGSLGHWFAGGTMSFHQKRKEAQNLHVLSKDKWSAERIVKINLRPKALSIPRNSAWILRYRQDKKTNWCLLLCYQNLLSKMYNTGRWEWYWSAHFRAVNFQFSSV